MRKLLIALLVMFFLAVLLVVGAWFAFLQVPDRHPGQADQLYEEYQERFQALQATPPEENGATLLHPLLVGSREEAELAPVEGPGGKVEPDDLVKPSEFFTGGGLTRNKALSAEEQQRAVEEVRAFNPVVALAQQAIRRPVFVWPARLEDGLNRSVPNFIRMRALGQGLMFCGLEAWREGRLAEALDSFLLVARFGRQMSGQGPLIQEMIAVAIAQMPMEALTELLASGKLGPQDYRTTLAGLEEVRFSPEGFGKAMEGEVAVGLSTFNGLREKGVSASTLGEDLHDLTRVVLLRLPPVRERERRLYTNFMLDQRRYFLDLMLASSAERSGNIGADMEEVEKGVLAPLMVPNYYRARISYRNLLSCQEANRLLAALQLYRAERGGWPPNLEALVPTWLPAVPRDFMAPDGQFRYRVQGRDMVLETESPFLKGFGHPENKRSYHPYLPTSDSWW